MARPNGVVLYRGPSAFDGSPIVVIVTGLKRRSKNGKTGKMLQSYVIREDVLPTKARKAGLDRSICGDCPHRDGTCHVNLRSPNAVWRALQAGKYPAFHRGRHARLFRGRLLRMGFYGDPAMVPIAAWEKVLKHVDGHTGYTHQWRTCDPEYRMLLMASADVAWEREEAVAAGWRTFRVRQDNDSLLPGEFECPASKEQGERLTCAECRACDGATDSPRAATPAIKLHGMVLPGLRAWRDRLLAAIPAKAEANRRVSLATL